MKSLLRVLLRRPGAAVTCFALALAAYFVAARWAEKPAWSVRVLLRTQTPPALAAAAQNVPALPLTPGHAPAWASILPGAPAVLNDATLAFERSGPSPEAAADAANGLAQAALTEGRERAERDRKAALGQVRDRLRREREAQAGHARDARREREAARSRHGSETLGPELRKIAEDILFHEGRRRDLDRRFAANRLRLERLRADRAVAEHLRRDSLPRLSPPLGSARLDENPRVARAAERVEAAHRGLVALLRERGADDPQALEARARLREEELELARARVAAYGQAVDREELAVVTDDELAAIELRVLEPEIRALRARAELLAPFHERAQAADVRAAEAEARSGDLEAVAALLDAAVAGYVHIESPARPADAVRAPARLLGAAAWGLATLAAAVAALLLAFLLDAADPKLRSDVDVLRHLGWPTLAAVPRTSRSRLLTLLPDERTQAMAETFDTLATLMLSVPSERPSRVFLITSAEAGEGKTTTAINLAAALGRQGKRALLVDGDLRSPAVHACFGLERANGFSDLLAGRSMPATPGVFTDTQLPSLRLLTCGTPGDSLYELLDPTRVMPVLGQLREQFDAIVLDAPPLLAAGDALKYSGGADATLFVVRAGASDARRAAHGKRLLKGVSANVAGVLLNQAGEPVATYPYERALSTAVKTA